MQVDKYIYLLLAVAKKIGNITQGNIREASIYFPKHIELTGVTETGEQFKLELRIGDRNENP
jgi:hypothetical protein